MGCIFIRCLKFLSFLLYQKLLAGSAFKSRVKAVARCFDAAM